MRQVLREIPRELHAAMIHMVREHQNGHGADGAPTKTVFIDTLYDPDSREFVYARVFKNGLVPSLRDHFHGKDQLLDGPFYDPASGLPKPSKQLQSSPTVHAETIATVTYSSNFIAAKEKYPNALRLGYLDQASCPRCMVNMILADFDGVYFDEDAKNREFFKAETKNKQARRKDAFNLSVSLAESAGLHMQSIDPDQPIEKHDRFWVEGSGMKRKFDFYAHGLQSVGNKLSGLNDEEIATMTIENIRDRAAYQNVLNPHSSYIAAAFVPGSTERRVYSMSSTLTLGYNAKDYRNDGFDARDAQAKYSIVANPLTALLIALVRENINPADARFFTSSIPLMRDTINALRANIQSLTICTDPEFISQVEQPYVFKKPAVHNSTHPESGEDRNYHVYERASAIKKLMIHAPHISLIPTP